MSRRPQRPSQGQASGSQNPFSAEIFMDLYTKSTSRGYPLPLPRQILEAAYPNDPHIVDALCNIKLNESAPSYALSHGTAAKFTDGWNPATSSVRAAAPPVARPPAAGPDDSQLGFNSAPDILLMTPLDDPHTGSSSDPHDHSMTFALSEGSANSFPARDAAQDAPDSSQKGKQPMRKGKQPMRKGKQPMRKGKQPMRKDKQPMQTDQQPASPPEGTQLMDDEGNRVMLLSPAKKDYFSAILHHEENQKTGVEFNHFPHRFPASYHPGLEYTLAAGQSKQNPFNLGPRASWAPYFCLGPPNAGNFCRAVTHVGSKDGAPAQLPMPFLRYLLATNDPLVLPVLGPVALVTPDFSRDVSPQEFMRPIDSRMAPLPVPLFIVRESSTPGSLRQDSVSIGEHALATGYYRDLNHISVAAYMIRSHMFTSNMEPAGVGLYHLTNVLCKTARRLGVLPQSAYRRHGPFSMDAPVSRVDKRVLWLRFYKLASGLLTEQVKRLKEVERHGLDVAHQFIQRPSPAETQLTGRTYRRAGMAPEPWWVWSRVTDPDWVEYFNVFYRGSDTQPSTRARGVHVSQDAEDVNMGGGTGSGSHEENNGDGDGDGDGDEDEDGDDDEDEDEDMGCDEDEDSDEVPKMYLPQAAVPARDTSRWPNIISKYTVESIESSLEQLYEVHYRSPRTTLRPDCDELLPRKLFDEVMGYITQCKSSYTRLGPRMDEVPESDLRDPAWVDGMKKYRHPIEQYSSIR